MDNQPAETVAKKNQPADNVAKTSDVAEPGADREGKRESYFSVIFDPCLITFLFQCSACLRLSVSTTTRARVTMARWECATRQPSARRRGGSATGNCAMGFGVCCRSKSSFLPTLIAFQRHLCHLTPRSLVVVMEVKKVKSENLNVSLSFLA